MKISDAAARTHSKFDSPTKLVFICLVGLLALPACVSMRMDLPASRLVTSETNGHDDHRFRMQAEAEAIHNYEFTPDASARPPTFTQPMAEKYGAAGLSASYGVAEPVDISLKTLAGPAPWVLTAKYQFVGPSHAKAQVGDFSVSGTFGFGYGLSSREGDQNGLFGPGGYNWKSTVTTTLTDYAVIAGFRTADTVLLYTGAFYTNYDLQGKIDQSASSNGLSPAATYTELVKGYQRGISFGIQFDVGTSGLVMLEGVYSDVQLSNTSDWLLSGSAAFGARF